MKPSGSDVWFCPSTPGDIAASKSVATTDLPVTSASGSPERPIVLVVHVNLQHRSMTSDVHLDDDRFFHHPGVREADPCRSADSHVSQSFAADKHTLCPLNGRVEENYRLFNGDAYGH
jgi:hypothetical protein